MRPSEDPACNSAPGRALPWLSAESQQTQAQPAGLTRYSENRQKGRVGCTRTAMVPSSPVGTTAPWSSTICRKDRHSSSAVISSEEHLLQPRAGHRRAADSPALLHTAATYLHVIRGNSFSQRARLNFHSFHIGTDCHLQNRFFFF